MMYLKLFVVMEVNTRVSESIRSHHEWTTKGEEAGKVLTSVGIWNEGRSMITAEKLSKNMLELEEYISTESKSLRSVP